MPHVQSKAAPAAADLSSIRNEVAAREKAGRVVKVTLRGPLIATYSQMYLQSVHSGLGFWLAFDGYVREAIEAGSLVSVLDDWCPSFPGPFLYYPSRRQPPPALAALLAFVATWRKDEWRRVQTKR